MVDAVQSGRTNPCGTIGMMMRGVEVDNSISIYASPDYIHTKWNISHEKPQFDYEQAANCIPSLSFKIPSLGFLACHRLPAKFHKTFEKRRRFLRTGDKKVVQ